MTAADWIAVCTPGLAVAGGLAAAVSKLTRMTVALEQLAEQTRRIVTRLDEHELRIGTLEAHQPGRHASGR